MRILAYSACHSYFPFPLFFPASFLAGFSADFSASFLAGFSAGFSASFLAGFSADFSDFSALGSLGVSLDASSFLGSSFVSFSLSPP